MTQLLLCFRQLILILELYNPNDVYDYLRHIALTLCSDKVSEVRWISFKLVSFCFSSLMLSLQKSYLQNKHNNLLNSVSRAHYAVYACFLFVRFKYNNLLFLRATTCFISFFFISSPLLTGRSNTAEVLCKQCKCTGIKFH